MEYHLFRTPQAAGRLAIIW